MLREYNISLSLGINLPKAVEKEDGGRRVGMPHTVKDRVYDLDMVLHEKLRLTSKCFRDMQLIAMLFSGSAYLYLENNRGCRG